TLYRRLALPEGKNMNTAAAFSESGSVVSVRGGIVDIRFENRVPPMHTLLRTGEEGKIVMEVLSQLDMHNVRGIALTPTQGLSRRMPVTDTQGPLLAPVGNTTLSRMFDVFGNAIDRLPAPANVQW